MIIERGRGWEFLLSVEWVIGMVKDGLVWQHFGHRRGDKG